VVRRLSLGNGQTQRNGVSDVPDVQVTPEMEV